MPKINSRRKGKVGELELAHKLENYGYNTRRGQQYSGIEGRDVVGLPNIHIECKRVEKLNIYEAMDQSIRDCKENEIPVVMHRKNHKNWLVTVSLDDFMTLYQEYAKENHESDIFR